MTEKRREMEARLRAEREQQRGGRLGAQEQAEIKAEEAEAKAYEASSLAADASDKADNANTKQAHFQAAQAHDRAAHTNSMASIAHQAYADAGGEDPAGSSSDYADTPAEAAKACESEMERHMAEAIYHRQMANGRAKQDSHDMTTVNGFLAFLNSGAGEGALGALLALGMVGVGVAAITIAFGPTAQAIFQSLLAGLAL